MSNIGKFINGNKKLSIGIGIGVVAIIGGIVIYKKIRAKNLFTQSSDLAIKQAVKTPTPISCSCSSCTTKCVGWVSKLTFGIL